MYLKCLAFCHLILQVAENETHLKMKNLRFNPHYVIWYKNVAIVVVSLILPFALLAYWNFNTFRVLWMRRRMRNRPFSEQTEQSTSTGQTSPPSAATAVLMLNGSSLLSLNRSERSASDQGIAHT